MGSGRDGQIRGIEENERRAVQVAGAGEAALLLVLQPVGIGVGGRGGLQ